MKLPLSNTSITASTYDLFLLTLVAPIIVLLLLITINIRVTAALRRDLTPPSPPPPPPPPPPHPPSSRSPSPPSPPPSPSPPPLLPPPRRRSLPFTPKARSSSSDSSDKQSLLTEISDMMLDSLTPFSRGRSRAPSPHPAVDPSGREVVSPAPRGILGMLIGNGTLTGAGGREEPSVFGELSEALTDSLAHFSVFRRPADDSSEPEVGRAQRREGRDPSEREVVDRAPRGEGREESPESSVFTV